MAYDKVVDSAVLDAKLGNIADAIRGKTGGADPLTLEQMVTEIEGIPSGGDTATEDGLLQKTLTEYENDRVATVGDYALYNQKAIESVSFPNALTVGSYVCSGCTSLKQAKMPLITTLGRDAFTGCTSLEDFELPSGVVMIAIGVFRNCSKLTKAIFPSVNNIQGNAFSGCSGLKTLVIKTNSVAHLVNVGAFSGSPFASGGTGGTVYVPSALIESYQTATNWSTLYAAGTCNFVAIEGSEYE